MHLPAGPFLEPNESSHWISVHGRKARDTSSSRVCLPTTLLNPLLHGYVLVGLFACALCRHGMRVCPKKRCFTDYSCKASTLTMSLCFESAVASYRGVGDGEADDV